MALLKPRPQAPLPQLMKFIVSGALFAGMGLMAIDHKRSSWQGTDDLVQVKAELLGVSCIYQQRSGKNSRDRWLFEPRYAYQWAGGDWVGQRYSRISEQAAFYVAKDCEAQAADFRQQRELRIWVSPSQPSYSVVDPTKPSWGAVETFMIGVGVLLWLWGASTYRTAMRPKPAVSKARPSSSQPSAALEQWMSEAEAGIRWRWLQTVSHRVVDDAFQLHLIQLTDSREYRVYIERDACVRSYVALQPGSTDASPESEGGRRVQQELLASAASEIAEDRQGIYWRDGLASRAP